MEPLREKLLPSSRNAAGPTGYNDPIHHSIHPAIRTAIRVLVLAISLSVTGSLTFGIWLRDATRGQQWLNQFGYRFEIWPKQFELDPTTVFLVAAGLSVLFNLLSLGAKCTGVGSASVRTLRRKPLSTSEDDY